MDVSLYNATNCTAINGSGLYPLKPYHAEKNPLDSRVDSDHAEIGIILPYLPFILNSWNISNPISHQNFECGPFKNSHLFVKDPLKDGSLNPVLLAKVKRQASVIANRVAKGEVDVQVIIEGSESFFNQLIAEFKNLGDEHQYQIVDKCKPENGQIHNDTVGIIYNKKSFEVKDKGITHIKYKEEADSGKPKEICLPYVHLKHNNEKYNHKELVIMGVHMPGSDTFCPKTGLEKIAEQIIQLYIKKKGQVDIIAVGDFNTTPAYAKDILLNRITIPSCLLVPDYLTHVNSDSLAAKYDFAVIAGWRNNIELYQPLPFSKMSEASQALVSSMSLQS